MTLDLRQAVAPLPEVVKRWVCIVQLIPMVHHYLPVDPHTAYITWRIACSHLQCTSTGTVHLQTLAPCGYYTYGPSYVEWHMA